MCSRRAAPLYGDVFSCTPLTTSGEVGVMKRPEQEAQVGGELERFPLISALHTVRFTTGPQTRENTGPPTGCWAGSDTSHSRRKIRRRRGSLTQPISPWFHFLEKTNMFLCSLSVWAPLWTVWSWRGPGGLAGWKWIVWSPQLKSKLPVFLFSSLQSRPSLKESD